MDLRLEAMDLRQKSRLVGFNGERIMVNWLFEFFPFEGRFAKVTHESTDEKAGFMSF